jgi:glycosyltransferase involved in cell wall biosynthesis
MSVPLRILVVTDAFPPNCGGSGWSTWELSRGLVARGHHVEIVKAEAGRRAGVFERVYDHLPVTDFARAVTTIPGLRNVAKNERYWAALAAYLGDRLRNRPVDIIHAQHVLTTTPAVRAGRAAGVPVVATVRDYWPVCYWSDLIVHPEAPNLCPACSAAAMTRCLRSRAGRMTPAAWSLIPYMRRNLADKRQTLARADAVIAVSRRIAADLEARAPELAGTTVFTIPNPVDPVALDHVHDHAERPVPYPYVLFAGKLAPNKGAQWLVRLCREARLAWPLVIVGDGPLKDAIVADARREGVTVDVRGWLPREDALVWMRHASVLAFPSYGPESLSRVLIEASMLGVPIAAMDTGGTRDIIQPGVTGCLSTDIEGLARDVERLTADERLRAALGAAARAEARARFATPSVVERVEQVYRSLLRPSAA